MCLYHLHLNNIRPQPRINSFPLKFIQRRPKTREHADIPRLPVLRQLRTNTVPLEKDTGNRDAVAKLLWSRQDATNKTRNTQCKSICFQIAVPYVFNTASWWPETSEFVNRSYILQMFFCISPINSGRQYQQCSLFGSFGISQTVKFTSRKMK